MKKYIIVTESGADIPKEVIEKYDIRIVPMHVTFGGVTYNDGEVGAEDVFKYYEQTKSLAQTSGSTPFDAASIFEGIKKENSEAEIIYVACSSALTISYNSARLAAEDFENIHLIDSKSVSVGAGFLVVELAKFIEANNDVRLEEVISFVEKLREQVRLSIVPFTLLYLKAGGRISNASYLGATLLKIFPSLELVDGYLVAGKKHRGSFTKAVGNMLEDFFAKYNIDKTNIKLVKALGIKDDHIKFIEEKLAGLGVEKVEWIDAGAVISTHGGPGAVGICGLELE